MSGLGAKRVLVGFGWSGLGELVRGAVAKPYKTKAGKVLTDVDIEAMSTEAEQGYDVEALKNRRRGRPMLGSAPAEVVPVRLDPDLKEAVEARTQADHTATSEFIREELRRFPRRCLSLT